MDSESAAQNGWRRWRLHLDSPRSAGARGWSRGHPGPDYRRLRSGPHGKAQRRQSMAGDASPCVQPACLPIVRRDRAYDRANCIQSVATLGVAAAWSNSGTAADLPVAAGAAFERLAYPRANRCSGVLANVGNLFADGALLPLECDVGADPAVQRGV